MKDACEIQVAVAAPYRMPVWRLWRGRHSTTGATSVCALEYPLGGL